MSKKLKVLKKEYPMEKLFTVNNFKYKEGTFLLNIGPDVYRYAHAQLGYDLNKPKKLESFLRKCFRSYFGFKKP